MKRTMILSAITAASLLTAAGQAQVVISQVYGGGGNSGATYRSDFVELKNIGTTPVTMTGWSIQYASATGPVATNSSPNNAWQVTPLTTITLQPGQYYLVKEADGANVTTSTPLPTPDATGTIAMSATAAKVALVNTTTPLPARAVTTDPVPSWSTLPQVVDFVGYGSTADHYEGTGRALAPSNSTSVSRASNGCTDTNDNSADFTTLGPASPHNSTNTVPCGASYPDISLTLANSGCSPTVGSAYTITASLSNLQTLAAANTTVTLVLPPTVTYGSSTTGGTGTASYNPATRTLTWSVGNFPASGSGTLTVNTTVADVGGIVVTGSATTTTPNDPTGNNTAINYNEVHQTGAPLSVIAGASLSDTSVATSVDENGTERKLGTIYRVFTSADGNWIIFRTDLNGLASAVNGAVIVGHNVAGTWSYSLVAREGTTAPVAASPNAKIDNSGVNNIQGINNSGQYVYSTNLRDDNGTPADTTDDILSNCIVKGTVAGGISSVIVKGDAAVATALAGRTYTSLSSATIQNDGTISFQANLSGTTATNQVFLKNDGNTVLAQKGVTIPGNATVAYRALDTDGSSDGRGVMVSADGSSWLGTGAVDPAVTTGNNVVVVNGSVAVREGLPVGSFTDGAGWATFGSQQVPWTQMLPDGSWYIHGYNPNTVGFNQGQDWVLRNGVLVASTGSSIYGTQTETWADNVLQRTFFLEAGAGNDYVVGGLTNRSQAANGSDDASDGVVIYRGSSVLVREGAPVQLAPSDTRYLNLINDNRSFVAGGKLYLTATLRGINDQCNRTFSNLPQAIVAVDLPNTGSACPADIGQQGGVPGSDNVLDNNDFIVYIDYFFNQDPRADIGQQGGVAGSDNQFDNNDFIVFIDQFFAGCGA